jgi:hypothetical protein
MCAYHNAAPSLAVRWSQIDLVHHGLLLRIELRSVWIDVRSIANGFRDAAPGFAAVEVAPENEDARKEEDKGDAAYEDVD